jgi:replicative superfamily II helicase
LVQNAGVVPRNAGFVGTTISRQQIVLPQYVVASTWRLKISIFTAWTMPRRHSIVEVASCAGSGKTVSAELSMLRVFSHYPKEKVLYIAPLKALVRERIKDWGSGLCKQLGKAMVELTGDYTPDLTALLAADIIICTPEKWDGISRNWQARGYVRMVRLVIMDEIHLLGSDRGPILEVIVSRMRYIAEQTNRNVRFVGLSTALANAQDLASWLGVGPEVRVSHCQLCSTDGPNQPCCFFGAGGLLRA